MAQNIRKQIRAAIVSRLVTAATAAGARVFPSRTRKIFESEMPAILVYTEKEPAEISNEAPREYKLDLQVSIEIVAQGGAEKDLDDTIDDICEQVLTAMFAEETLAGLVSDTILSDTETTILTDGAKPTGAAKISLIMPYYMQLPGDLTAALPDLQTVGTEMKPPTFGDDTPKTEVQIDFDEEEEEP